MPKSKEFVEDSDSEEATATKSPPAKKTKTETASATNQTVASKTGPSGEQLYEIGKMRYISVNAFKGKPYVNIREYYEDKGVEKPGKKGISLTREQWDQLKSLINQVDQDLRRHR